MSRWPSHAHNVFFARTGAALRGDDVRSGLEPHRVAVANSAGVAMIRHWAFFKQSDTSFGTFYPRHYIVAGYPSLHNAQEAEHAFTESGVGVENVRATTGDFVINQLEAHRGANWLQRAEARIAEFAGTETGFLEDDAELARKGGAFLFLFAPESSHVEHARKVFAEHRPSYARRYLHVAIERIIDPMPRRTD